MICHLLHQSSRNYILTTLAALILEVFILTIAPWFIWLMDLPYQAGVTLVSQYSIVILIRWLTVLLFQYDLFVSILNFTFGLASKFLEALRHAAGRYSTNSTVDETQNPLVPVDPNKPERKVGRPRKI